MLRKVRKCFLQFLDKEASEIRALEEGIDSLFLIRTPFQGWLASKIISQERLSNYDVVYFTHDDSLKDRYYFDLLKKNSRSSKYLVARRVSRQALYHYFIYLKLFFVRWRRDYEKVFLSSFDSYLFRVLARRCKGSKIVTFDDGAANISASSPFYRYSSGRLSGLYNFLLGSGSRESFKKIISYHYTVYPGFNNIVEAGKLKPLKLLDERFERDNDLNGERVVFFIGQPFDELVSTGVLGEKGFSKLKSFIKDMRVDYYLQHPRELCPLDANAVVVNESGKVAEELIFDLAGSGIPVVYSSFSTVILNLPSGFAKKVYLSLGSGDDEEERKRLCSSRGCEVYLMR